AGREMHDRTGGKPAGRPVRYRHPGQRLSHQLRGAAWRWPGHHGRHVSPDDALPAGRLQGDPVPRRQRLAGAADLALGRRRSVRQCECTWVWRIRGHGADRRPGGQHRDDPRTVPGVLRDPGVRDHLRRDRDHPGDPPPAAPTTHDAPEENLNEAFAIVIAMIPMPLHAFGARYDLPAPLYLFLIGAGAVVCVSFLLVLRRPVTRMRPTGDDVPPVPQVGSWPGWLLFVIAVFMVFGSLLGTQSTPDNIVVTAFWLVFWIALPISIAVIGNYWPYISPLNVVARAVGPKSRIEWNTSWGYWPATILFFLFACGELVFNGVTTTPAGTAQVLLAYGIVNAVMAYLFGAETWLRRGEVFSVLFATWGRLGYFRFGTPGTRGFVAGLLPSLVPIAFGYLLAHNFDYLAINGQLLIHQASDPFGNGLNLFGTVNYEPNRNLIPTAVVWYFEIVLIIGVHIAAVVLAHGYLGRVARTESQGRRAEWPWIAAMVGYTMTSLWLLAQPIVQEGIQG